MTPAARLALALGRYDRLAEVYVDLACLGDTGAMDLSPAFWKRLARVSDARKHAARIVERLETLAAPV